MRNPDVPKAQGSGHVRRRLSAGEAVLSYWALPNRILVTLVTPGGTEHIVLPVSRASIRTLVQRLNRSIEVGSDALVAAALDEIDGALMRPVEHALRSTRRLWIIPDRDLWDVPFAGLSARDGEPLASRFEIAFTSSLESLARSKPPWEKPTSILAVGNPSWDRSLFGDLPSLPESLDEARAVAALYPRGRVLVGREATRRTVQRLAPGADIVHIATHAVGNDRDPGESFLLLSAEGSDPGPWRASEPGWDSLSRARLVVLSACRTSTQRSRFGGASLGVLRSIRLSTDAQVLASTGDVDDAASRRLLEAFHRHLLAGGPPAAALRQAQIEAHRERSGMTWMLYRIVI
jgi:CHAT domain-containing protein